MERRLKIHFAWEAPSRVIAEMVPLTIRQQEEVGKDYEPYNPNWGFYLARERGGTCKVWTARVPSGELVGYIVWIISKGKHCIGTKFAEADVVYLNSEWRKGMTGYDFVRSGIDAVKGLADIVRIETNDLYEDGRLGLVLKRAGMIRVGSIYRSKEIPL